MAGEVEDEAILGSELPRKPIHHVVLDQIARHHIFGSDVDRVESAGVRQVASHAFEIVASAVQVQKVVIIGHTSQEGNAATKRELSQTNASSLLVPSRERRPIVVRVADGPAL